MEKCVAIVLSAGSGSRMKSDIPKQYLTVNDKPVIYYTLKAFEESAVDQVILVTGAGDTEYCRKEIVNKYGFQKVHAVVPGGAQRYDSVYQGLKAVSNGEYVLVHDGARPLVTPEMIGRAIEGAREYGACVLAMPVKDTIKIAEASGYAVDTPDRSMLWQVQTPQAFSYELLMTAYERMYRHPQKEITITDDAMVVETFTDKKIRLVEGSYRNIKITTPEDLEIMKIFLKK